VQKGRTVTGTASLHAPQTMCRGSSPLCLPWPITPRASSYANDRRRSISSRHDNLEVTGGRRLVGTKVQYSNGWIASSGVVVNQRAARRDRGRGEGQVIEIRERRGAARRGRDVGQRTAARSVRAGVRNLVRGRVGRGRSRKRSTVVIQRQLERVAGRCREVMHGLQDFLLEGCAKEISRKTHGEPPSVRAAAFLSCHHSFMRSDCALDQFVIDSNIVHLKVSL